MNLLDTKRQIPDIYCQESRDFQILCNIYSAVTNGVKFNSDSTVRVLDSASCRGEMLDLLSTKMGFFTTKNFSAEDLRYALSGFKDIMYNKGTLTSVASAVNIFLKTLGIHNRVRITLTTDDVEFGGRLIKDHTVIISIESAVSDVTLLEEIFKYIIPFGYEYYITFYLQVDPYDEFELHENVTLIYVSDNINSTIGKTTVAVTNVLPVSYYDGNKYSADVGYYGDKCYWKVNDDWSVTATYNPDATYTSNTTYICNSYYQWIILEPGSYWCYGCPEGGGSEKYFIDFTAYGIGSTSGATVSDYGSGKSFKIQERKRLAVSCVVYKNYVTSDMTPITFKPVVIKDPGTGHRPTNHIPPSLFTHTTDNYVTITYHETGPSNSTEGWSTEVKSDGTIVLNGKNTYVYSESMVLLDPLTFQTYPTTSDYTYTSNLTNLSADTLYSTLNNRPQPSYGTSYSITSEPFTCNCAGGNYLGLSLVIGKQYQFNNDEFKPMLTLGSEARPFIQPGTTQNMIILSDTPISDTGNRILGGVNDGEVIGTDSPPTDAGLINYFNPGYIADCCSYDNDTNTLTVNYPNLTSVDDFENNKHPSQTTGLPETYSGRICNMTPIDVTNINSVKVTYSIPTSTTGTVYFIYALRDANGLVFRKNGNTSGTTVDVTNGTELYIGFYPTSGSLTTDMIEYIKVIGDKSFARTDIFLGIPQSPIPTTLVATLPKLSDGTYAISHEGTAYLKLCRVSSGGTVTVLRDNICKNYPYTFTLSSNYSYTLHVSKDQPDPAIYPQIMICKSTAVPSSYIKPSVPAVSAFNYRGLAKALTEIYDPVANDLVGLVNGNDCYVWNGERYDKKVFAGNYPSLSVIPDPIEDAVVHITSSQSYYYRASYGWVNLNYRGDAKYIEDAVFTDLQVNDLVITNHVSYYLYQNGIWSWYNQPIKIYKEVATVT